LLGARLTELNMQEIGAYLGYAGREIPEEELPRMRQCAEAVAGSARPSLVYRRVKLDRGSGRIDAGGLILPGDDICSFLEGCSEAVIFAATCGLAVDSLISVTQVKDMALAVIMDACASCAAENICDNFEEDMRRQLKTEGLFLTDRFSPGYGDLPLYVQKEIGIFLNAQRRIGLIVSDRYLMTPVKSVTAVMGISDGPVKLRKSKCETCSSAENCRYAFSRDACR